MLEELFVTDRIKVSELVPSVKNPRKIKAAEKRKLWERLEKYGMISLPTCTVDKQLIGGHQRLSLMVQNGLGDTMIDVRRAVRELTEDELAQVMLIDNVQAGEFDLQKLQDEFSALIDLDEFGIDMSELEKQISEATDELSNEAELPVVAKMSEKYTSFVVICRNEIDETHIAEKLGIKRGRCYKSSKVGTMHVIEGSNLIATWKQ